MSISARLEKLRFLAAEMQLAFHLSQFAPTDFEARVLVRHVIVRAEGFIKHARGLRRPLIRDGFQIGNFHRAKENYATIFDEYFQLVRDRLGAHVQDLDFGRRIELWNDIEISKSEFFADGAVEVYRMLGELSIPGYMSYADFPVLSDLAFKEALKAYRESGSRTLRVEIGSDPLAMTRPNTSAILNQTPVHARAGQIALIHRWIKIAINQMDHFRAFPNVLRIVRARLITDAVSACDCLITRQLTAGALQQMDGLDALLDEANISPNPISAFVAAVGAEAAIAPFRLVRDKVGAHLEIDPTVTLQSLLETLDCYDLDDLLNLYGVLRNVFEKVCRNVLFLKTYLVDGQTLYGVLGTSGSSALPFDANGGNGRVAAIPEQFLDTDDAYAAKLEFWLSGPEDARGAARSYFYAASLRSEVKDSFTKTEYLGGGSARYVVHQFRRVHRFLLGRLEMEAAPERITGILELITQLRSGDPDVLTELLLRFSKSPNSAPYFAGIAYSLGVTASWSNEEAKAFLFAAMGAFQPFLAFYSCIALFKMFVTSEGLKRINPPHHPAHSFSELDVLTQGLAAEEKLVTLIVLASQFCDQHVAAFAKPFDADYASMRAEIAALSGALAPPAETLRVADMVGRLAVTHDFAGVSLFLFEILKGTPHEATGHDLVLLVCQGLIVVAYHDQAHRHLCGCYLNLELKQPALKVAERLAAQNPDNVDHQLLRLQVMASMPEHAVKAQQVAQSLRQRYILTSGQLATLDEVGNSLNSEI